MNNFLVSVIIPNYNHGKYLEQRIRSVLDQTYNNFEVIILDDKSSDNSRDVIEKYRNSPHVSNIVYNVENSGSTFRQWRKGFGIAKGNLVWIAESDDYCEPNFLEELVPMFEKDKCLVIAYADLMQVDSLGNSIPNTENNRHSRSGNEGLMDGKHFIRKYGAGGCPIWNASSAIFRKDAALTIDRKYESFRSAGDFMFWIEMAEQGNVYKSPKKLDYFRRHDSSVTMTSGKLGITNRERYLIHEYLVKNRLITGISRMESYITNLEIAKSLVTNKGCEDLVKLWDPHNLMSPRIFYLCQLILKFLKTWK